MNQAHTPGPWKAQRDLYNTPYEEKGFGIYSEVTHLRLAVIEPALNGANGHNMENQEPTARLIAAAPELLDALEAYARMTEKVLSLETFSEKDLSDLKTALRFIAPQTRAVIAKAKGSQPA